MAGRPPLARVSPAGPRHGCRGSGWNPPPGLLTGQVVCGQAPPAPGLPAAHGSPQAGKWDRRLNPAQPTPPSPQGYTPRLGLSPQMGASQGVSSWSRDRSLQVEEFQGQGAFKNRGSGGGSPCPHKPGHYGCRRPASDWGPGGSFDVPPSTGLPRTAPPPGSHGVALCLHPEGKEKLRGLHVYPEPRTMAYYPLWPLAPPHHPSPSQ